MTYTEQEYNRELNDLYKSHANHIELANRVFNELLDENRHNDEALAFITQGLNRLHNKTSYDKVKLYVSHYINSCLTGRELNHKEGLGFFVPRAREIPKTETICDQIQREFRIVKNDDDDEFKSET